MSDELYKMMRQFAGNRQITKTLEKLDYAIRSTSNRVVLTANDRSTAIVLDMINALGHKGKLQEISVADGQFAISKDVDCVIVATPTNSSIVADGETPRTCLYTPTGCTYLAHIPLLYWRESDKREYIRGRGLNAEI